MALSGQTYIANLQIATVTWGLTQVILDIAARACLTVNSLESGGSVVMTQISKGMELSLSNIFTDRGYHTQLLKDTFNQVKNFSRESLLEIKHAGI